MRSRVNSVSVWLTSAMFTKTPFAVAGSISIWSWIVWGVAGFSVMRDGLAGNGRGGYRRPARGAALGRSPPRRAARDLGALVREVVRAHGGAVEVRSAEGEGTTFTVR